MPASASCSSVIYLMGDCKHLSNWIFLLQFYPKWRLRILGDVSMKSLKCSSSELALSKKYVSYSCVKLMLISSVVAGLNHPYKTKGPSMQSCWVRYWTHPFVDELGFVIIAEVSDCNWAKTAVDLLKWAGVFLVKTNLCTIQELFRVQNSQARESCCQFLSAVIFTLLLQT